MSENNSNNSSNDFKVKTTVNHSLDHLKFIFSQSEKLLEDSNKVFDSTTNKSITLITLCVALLSTTSAYFIVNNDIKGTFNSKLFTALCLSIYVFIVLFYLLKNILKHKYYPIGSHPSLLLTGAVKDDETSHKNALYSEFYNYEKRANHNYNMNKIRTERVDASIKYLIYFPIIGLIIYLLTDLVVILNS